MRQTRGRRRRRRRGEAPERSSPISTKSLKCPACSEASWRLSEKLSSLRASGCELAVASQLADGREAEDGRRRAAPAGAERAELAEVGALRRPVRHAAAQAEAERRRDEVAGQPGRRDAPAGRQRDRPRQPVAEALADGARQRVEPVRRHPLERSSASSGLGHGCVEDE